MTQKQALEILKTGVNVFLTGAAGSGKTHVLREYLSCLKKHKVAVGVTASTGIAATHMNGVTIHSWTGIGIKDELSDWDIDAISQKEKTATRIRDARVLIIDEISMLHHFQLDMVNRVLKYVRNCSSPFGGLQLVVCGDFFQLPPISRKPRSFGAGDTLFLDEYESNGDTKFAYHSRAWREAQFTVCYLEENHRQNDTEYLKILNAVRNNSTTPDIVSLLKSRFRAISTSLESDGFDGTVRDYSSKSKNNLEPRVVDRANRIKMIKLYSHNTNVDIENDKELMRLNVPVQKYEMTSRGNRNLVETLKKSCLAPEVLRLKEGAKVMFVKNNFEKGFVNGTLGIVRKCNQFEIVVATSRGHVRVEREIWMMIGDNDKILAEIEQYPLRLAWAITIHKSQGMSLDEAEIDLSRSFEKGMGYVALSRVKTLNGLSLTGLNENALKVNEESIKFDKHFKILSDKAVAELTILSQRELKDKQVEFIGPEPVVFDKTSAYRRDDENHKARLEVHDDIVRLRKQKNSSVEKTKQLLDSGMTIKDVVAERGLKFETIICHIEEIMRTSPTWNISRFRSIIPEKRLVKIIEAFKHSGVGKDGLPFLSVAKNRLGVGYSWEEIKIARLFI